MLAENRELTISCPVLLLVGERDRTGKVKKYCRAWHNKEGYPLILLKDAAHNSNFDNWQETNRRIEEFLSH